MVFDPNKQLVLPTPPAPTITITGAEWDQGQLPPSTCVPIPPGTFPPIVCTLLDDFPTFKRYEPVPQPPWGIVQVIGTGGGFWTISASYTVGGTLIVASWVGPSFDPHPSPSGAYIFNHACTSPPFLFI